MPDDTTTYFERMAHPLSPTTVLPTLATLLACNATCVEGALGALQDVYFPHGTVPVLKQSLSVTVPALKPKRTRRLVHQDDVPDSGYASAEEDDQSEKIDEATETRDSDAIEEEATENEDKELGILRSDELERGYAIKWLTGLVKRGDAWVCGPGSSSFEEQEARTNCLEMASRLLARFAGDDAPEEALTRTFVFPFCMPTPCHRRRWEVSPSTLPITVELNDAPVNGTDHTAVGLQSWGSAIVFAERLCLDPERYLGALHSRTSVSTATPARHWRLLELGAGTGLLSITVAQILSRTSVQAKIKATDYHPSVLENLARNVWHNQSAVGMSVEKLDWYATSRIEGVGDSVGMDEGEDDVYDVVLAADVVYHPEHASWIRGCVEHTLKKGGVFWLIFPVRTVGRHEGLVETIEEAFPVWGGVSDGKEEGEHLAIVYREEVERVEGVGRADEGGYTLFEIRWVVD